MMINRTQLRDDLVIAFNEPDLEVLCERLDVAYSELNGKTQRDRVSVLIGRLERNHRLGELVAYLVAQRPQYVSRYGRFAAEPGQTNDDESSSWLLDYAQGEGNVVEEGPTMVTDWDRSQPTLAPDEDEDE